MLNSICLAIIAGLFALCISQCEQKNDAQKALLDANTHKATAEINKALCEATRDSQGETIRTLSAESERRKADAASAMDKAKTEQGRQAALIENIRRAPSVGDNCEAIRIKLIEDSKQ